ncbi:DUF6527 family protein [Bacteroides sp. CR5/BHMF/2]|nr:DUF6527 family protein [Bacteroides sp. CR5/BHMF/2]
MIKGNVFILVSGLQMRPLYSNRKNDCGFPVWNWNGDNENPTVIPSIKVTYPTPEKMNICHSFIRNGKIEYLSDCTHELAGKTVDMIDIDDI